MNTTFNNTSLDTLCASLCRAMGIVSPKYAADSCKYLDEYVDKILDNKKADRIFMYNPDAIGQWIYEKYPQLFTEVKSRTDIEVPFATVMPSVTPVCFGTMYTGAQPEIHGIQTYEKPVIKIETIFDVLIKAGKKPVIIADKDCSLAKIYLERNMDHGAHEIDGNCGSHGLYMPEDINIVHLYKAVLSENENV